MAERQTVNKEPDFVFIFIEIPTFYFILFYIRFENKTSPTDRRESWWESSILQWYQLLKIDLNSHRKLLQTFMLHIVYMTIKFTFQFYNRTLNGCGTVSLSVSKHSERKCTVLCE